MVAADGPAAWGAIALGQAIGAIAYLVVSYGWAVSGPATIARGDVSVRRREYADSVRVKLILLLPGAASAALVAGIIANDHASFAVAGAISTTTVALTSNWYFAGLARPYVWLLLETLPRIAGTAAGIALMRLGQSAITGLACISGGMFVAFILVTIWVHRSTAKAGAVRLTRDKLSNVLASHRHGIASIIGAQLFLSAPLAIVSVLAPSAQPVFALVDKVRQLVSAGLNPVVTVFQGWVPRGTRSGNSKRSRVALAVTCVVAAAVCGLFVAAGPTLLHWLGDGQIAVPEIMIILAALVTAIGLFDSVLAYAVLASFGRLQIAARTTAISIIVMLPIVTIGTLHFGAVGALAGTVFGLLVRVAVELICAARGASADRVRVTAERGGERG